MAIPVNSEDVALPSPPHSPTIDDENDGKDDVEQPQMEVEVVVESPSITEQPPVEMLSTLLDDQHLAVRSILKRPGLVALADHRSPVKQFRFDEDDGEIVEHVRFISPRRADPLLGIDSITVDLSLKRRRESRRLYEDFLKQVRHRQRASRLQVPQPVSGWLVCDSVLEALDAHLLADVLVTRLDAHHPPRLLLEEACQVELEALGGRSPLKRFPVDTIRTVFVACGMDALTPRPQPDGLSASPVEFVKELEEWLAGMATGDDEEGDEGIRLVVVTVPEADVQPPFAPHISRLNEQLREYVELAWDGNEPSREKRVTVEMLDWDLALKECVDSAPLTEEGKIRTLVEAMHVHYGVEFLREG